MGRIRQFNLFLGGQRLVYLLSWLAIVFHVALAALIPLIIRFFLDHILAGQPVEASAAFADPLNRFAELISGNRIGLILLIILLLTAVQGVFMFLRGKLAALAGENGARRLRNRLYDHIMHQPFEFQSKTQTGDLIQRCTSDIETVQNFLTVHAVEAAAIVVQVIVVVIVMVRIDPVYTLISAAFIPLIVFLTIRFFLSMMTVFLAVDEAEGELTATLQESLTGIRVVKAFAAQDLEKEKFDGKNHLYRNEMLRIMRLMANFWSSTDFISMFQFVLVILAGAWLTVRGQITIGTLAAFGTYAGMLIWPVRGLGQMMGYMGQSFVALDRIQEILDSPVEDETSGRQDLNVKGDIVFDDVCYAYPDQEPVLDHLSLHIPAGSTAAILGATGTGKSTLVHLLLRLYDYQCGSIRLDGVELRDINRRYLRSQIGLVLQEPFLFSRDLADNIRIGRHDAGQQDIVQAARMASLHETVKRFEQGYRTPVGERGVTLSGGQRQRVAIARTLLRSAPVLIFDDSLSAVDSETDRSIRDALKKRKQKTTTLIISHRITTLAQADQILVLDRGRIVQQGTHEALIKQDGIYRQVWQMQSGLDL